MEDRRPHINYALVEETRPPMYTAMKYWGKKPHNIWSQFIERYCSPNGLILDPFVGSALAAFEAVKLGRKAIAFDLNPLTTFIIEVFTSDFNEADFIKAFEDIFNVIENDPIYAMHYNRIFESQNCTVYNYRWLSDKVVKVALERPDGTKTTIASQQEDNDKALSMLSINIKTWFPINEFPVSPFISHKFIHDIGGNSFEYLWTRRNLYFLSLIFHEILQQTNQSVKMQLLSGFIQTLHLTSKMVVPRNEAANRDFSGSWGRPDYMIRRNSMEQNPLIVFKRSCVEKQSILSAMRNAKTMLPVNLKVNDVIKSRKIKPTSHINYGILDVSDIHQYLQERSVDFIITDPPYAGLVPYIDLSLIWLVWLQKIDIKYMPDMAAEITLKKGIINREEYRRRLQNAFKQLHRVLKDDGYIVITFHHQKIQEWNDFVHAVRLAGFKFDKVTHQYNRRSGEANVANPYGTSGADFYIRCVKHRDVDFSNDSSGLEHFIVQKAIEIIATRNEATPFDYVISGLLPEMLQAGYMQPKQYYQEIEQTLNKLVGPDNIFVIKKNTVNKGGDYWWFNNPGQYINFPDLPLKERVEETVISILRRRVSVKLDDVLSELFRTFPNGLTPHPQEVKSVLEKYAFRSSGNWKILPATIIFSTEHTEIIRKITIIGKRAHYRVFIGKREQPESCKDGNILRSHADITELSSLSANYQAKGIERIEMIDVLWLSKTDNTITCIFEVENTTGFTSAIQRGSNIEPTIPKFMIIPSSRERELLSVVDPLFIAAFQANNWRYITYDVINRLESFSTPSLHELLNVSKTLSTEEQM